MSEACNTHGRDEKCMSRLKDNIKMDLREKGWEIADCMHLTQDRDQ
jgi:hypothetical protein